MAYIVAYSGVYYIEQGAYTPGVPPELRNTFRAEVICYTRSELYSQHWELFFSRIEPYTIFQNC